MEDVIPSIISDDNQPNLDVASEIDEIEPRYNLRSRIHNIESEIIEENVEDMNEELETVQSPVNFKDIEIDLEDLQGTTLNDALDTVEGKNRLDQIVKWPNDAYRDFIELIVEGNISNKIGDKIIKFFNNHSNLKNSPLPSSTKNGKVFLDQIDSPSIDFKEKVVATYNEVNFTLYYRPIFRAIKVLLQRSEVVDNFVHKGILKKDDITGTRIFGEPYECNWWLETKRLFHL
jgi:hypothetical protein